MMCLTSAVVALALLGGQERFGLSTTQILKYSPEKWIEFYENKVQKFDPITDGEAADVYAKCIRERYDPKLKALAPDDRTRISLIKIHSVGFKNECFGIQYVVGGGGSIYSHLQRITVIDDAQLIESILMKSKAPLQTETQVAAAFKSAGAWLDKQSKPNASVVEMIKPTGSTVATLKKDIGDAKSHLDILIRLVKKRPLNERAHVAGYVKRWIEPIVGE